MADIYIEYLPPTGNSDFDIKAQKLVDILRTYLSEHDTSLSVIESAGYTDFVDRGDPAAFDFAVGDLTTDGTWKTGASALDLSSIVPTGATAVLLLVGVQDDAAGNSIQFRKAGNSNAYNVGLVVAPVADVDQYQQVIVQCSTDRKIDYKASNTTFTTINILVSGWFV